MTNVATQQGAPQGAEPKTEKPFPDPPLGEGVDSGAKNSDDTPKMVSPRDAVLLDMDSRIDEERQNEIQLFQTELAEASGMEAPAGDADPGEPAEPGVATIDKMHPEGDDKNKHLPDDLRDDPLADYIVMNGEDAMFKTKVDGEERLIPLESARAQLQKGIAGEIRLQQAAERNKELDAREEQIRKSEAALAQKLNQPAPASPPSSPDVSDQDLQEEARQVVTGLFSGTEDQAVESLTHLLQKVSQAPGPQIDPTEVANQAVAAAKQQLTAEQQEEAEAQKLLDQAAAFESFSKEFKDITGDAALFRYADGLTDEIEVEHPEFTPLQVMTEAGNRTRKWVEELKGSASEQDPPPNNDRQNRKKNLTPMPQSRSAAHPAGEQEEQPDTPQSLMDEVRKARGQA